MANVNFKKGDNVLFIQNWDSEGTVAYRYATVNSFGKKICTLRNLDGSMFERDFYVSQLNTEWFWMLPADSDPMTEGLKAAEVILANTQKRYQASGYNQETLAAQLAKLHAPRVIQYEGR